MRHAVIDQETRKVKNVIIWDGVSKWTPPSNHYMVRHDECDIGDTHECPEGIHNFIKPEGRNK